MPTGLSLVETWAALNGEAGSVQNAAPKLVPTQQHPESQKHRELQAPVENASVHPPLPFLSLKPHTDP